MRLPLTCVPLVLPEVGDGERAVRRRRDPCVAGGDLGIRQEDVRARRAPDDGHSAR